VVNIVGISSNPDAHVILKAKPWFGEENVIDI
jgi:hypothetical protein